MNESRVAVVTGATAGVGRATAERFAQCGFDVALLARGEAGLSAAALAVKSHHVRALAISVDVSDYEAVDAAAARVEEELGPIDIWVNDAMTTVFSPLADLRAADFERAVRVTFLGQVWGTMAALSRMRARDAGTVVNVGSALAYVAIPLQSAYCASKFACRGFFEATRAELLHDHSSVRLCMVQLPAVNTPQFDWCETTMSHHPQPVPPIYPPETAARAIVEVALSGQRSKVLGSWNKVFVLLGSVMPGFANQYAARGAWDSQLTSQPIDDTRPSNLFSACDVDRDFGAHGIFDDQSRGALDPSFWRGTPTMLADFVHAAAATWSERRVMHRARRSARALLDGRPEAGLE
jgi:short-subunit dehydrogenase